MATSENGISYFGAGGHSHDGNNSTLISTASYSLFDFKPGYIGSQSRIAIQVNNQKALEDWLVRTINEKVLSPAGLDLAPDTLSGKVIRANTITATQLQANTITADEIAANAITADEIAAGAITASELSANIVLVNNVISSNNYIANTSGWKISSNGFAEFDEVSIRGNVVSSNGNIGGWLINSNTISSSTGGTILNANGYILANSGKFSGQIESSSGNIGGFSISSTTISSNNLTISSDGTITAGTTDGVRLTNDGYIQGIGGSGIRFKDSVGGTGNTQIFPTQMTTGTMYADNFNIPGNYFDAKSIGTTIETSGNRPLILKRNYVASAKFISFVSTTSGANVGHVGFANTTGIAFETTSDARLKENLVEIKDSLNIISNIIPYSYNFIEDPENTTHGFVAQQVYEHYPYPVVVGGEVARDEPWMLDYARFVPLLLAGIKEANQKILALEVRIKQLEGL